ncbi:MAG: S1C family serine protease [Candidatus Kapaibacteriota bacterium]
MFNKNLSTMTSQKTQEAIIMRQKTKTVFLLIISTFIIFTSGNTIFAQKSKQNQIYENAEYSKEIQDQINKTRQNAISIASAKAREAVVGINVTELQEVMVASNPFGMDPFFQQFFGMFAEPRYRQVQSLGSGFIISPDGYILTNHHVAGNAKKIVVTLTNGEKYNAELIGADMVSDVALLKIDASNLPYLRFANSDDLMIGEWVVAMGNPFGLFDMNSKPTVTVGVVSNTGVSFINQDKPYNRVYRDMIQTDAAISSGNSGGPLLNINGDVIGMNAAIYSTAQSYQGAGSIGIGFAIPINRIKVIIDQLYNKRKIDRNIYIGMEVDEINDQYVRYFKLDKQEGVIVTRVYRNSPAEKYGIEIGDIILAIDDNKIFHSNDYYVNLFDGIVGQEMSFEILRNGKIINKNVKLESSRR